MNDVILKNAFRMSLLCAVALAAPAWAGCGHASGAKFKSMDANNDGLVSSAEHAAGVTRMFGEMDTNGDGKVTASEMDAGHAMKVGKSTEARTMNDASMDEGSMRHDVSSADRIATMDTDGDGMLSSAEHDAGAATMFTDLDTDKNGSLSKQEMSAGHAMKKSKP
jgi:Ca2+-binding EF-hand superfamily protein